MSRLRRGLHRLRMTDWGWLQFKVVLAVWSSALFLFPPAASSEALGPVYGLVAGVVLLGAIISATGLVSSRQPGTASVLGLTVELVGLFFVLGGVVSYFFTQIAIIVTSPWAMGSQRIAFACFTFAMGSAVVARLLIILEARHAVAVGKSRRIA